MRRGGPNVRAVLEVAGAHNHQALGYESCFERGIEVGSVAPAFATAVAEMALGLTLAATRGIVANDRDFRDARELWLHAGNVGYNTLFDKSVGFVGCGGLSIELQRLLDPFRVTVRGFDPFLADHAMAVRGIERADLPTLFTASDVIYLLAAPTYTSRGMIDRHLLELLQPSQTLILISRAALVDFDALTQLVGEERFRLGVDVFPEQPLPVDHSLRKAPAAVLSSHRAGAVSDALLAIGDMVVADLEAIFGGRSERRLQFLTPERSEALLQPPPE